MYLGLRLDKMRDRGFMTKATEDGLMNFNSNTSHCRRPHAVVVVAKREFPFRWKMTVTISSIIWLAIGELNAGLVNAALNHKWCDKSSIWRYKKICDGPRTPELAVATLSGPLGLPATWVVYGRYLGGWTFRHASFEE